MRSQATKPLPKKGASSKSPIKTGSTAKQTKKKSVSPKKIKNLVSKALVKSPKRANVFSSKDEVYSSKTDSDSSVEDRNESPSESSRASTSSSPRDESPSKKTKKEPKGKKVATKIAPSTSVKKTNPKKTCKQIKKGKLAYKTNLQEDNRDNFDDSESDDVKYKINLDLIKNISPKLSKAKTTVKKGNATGNKKKELKKHDVGGKEQKIESSLQESEHKAEKNATQSIQERCKEKDNSTNVEKDESNIQSDSSSSNNLSNVSSPTQPETPKQETERPPKFFTSSRSPRTVDIDVKFCKTSKGNLSVSERFLSMKCESKTDELNKDRSSSTSTFVSQGPEIDVYTFTEKVDSPKSILSDFRNPVNKNIGRVRPIARVKGTVIDKKTEIEKKKYSPHRPIEEVVKLLKASKRSEETITYDVQSNVTGDLDLSIIKSDKDADEKPKPIVSKSYKMVARKSSITGKPFSPIKFFDQEPSTKKHEKPPNAKKSPTKPKRQKKKGGLSDDDIETSKFALNTKKFNYSSSEESESNDENDTKESSESDSGKAKRTKNKKYKRITDSSKKKTSKELKELSKDSLIDLKDDDVLLGSEKPSKRRLKLLSMWSGPKKHRMASLNAIAKVHCLYENESRTHMELGLMKTVERQIMPGTSKQTIGRKKEMKHKEMEKPESSTSESEYESKKESKQDDSSESSDDNPPQRSLRGEPGIRSAGKYWDPKSCTSSSEDSEMEYKKKIPEKKKITKTSTVKSDSDKLPVKMKKTAGVPLKKKRNRTEIVMDLKDMVVQKRMASLNATAILAASYEKRSPKSSKDDTTSDSCSDESFSQKSKNGLGSGVKSEIKREDTKMESEDSVLTDRKQKVEVIVNQESDVTITGVYATHHHEGFCTVSGMQYRISSTSHTQTTATANCEKDGCPRDDGARYTPLSALSSMQPPEHSQSKSAPVPELGGLSRRPGCSSAFSAPSPSAPHEPGYYQPAGPLIKETSADAERALARYHPPPHYHAPHPPVLQQYGPPYYPADLCYGRFYRPPGPYHMPPPQPDGQMVGVGGDPYPPPQYYGTPPCYQHSPQRIPYVEYRGCPCPMNACPKNVLTGPATGKAPTGGGPDIPIRGACRPKAKDSHIDAHGSGKDPPLEPEPPAAADAPLTGPLPAIGGASPKREFDIPASPARAEPAPIDLTTDDRPILDVKKENEGPVYAQSRKTDAQALREHNTSNDPAKAVKRRYSRPKLEIDMKDTQLEDACKTNGIGEHVKLQKRRKVSSEQTEVPKPETATKETKRKPQNGKRTPKIPTEKKTVKRKLEVTPNTLKAKKMLFEPAIDLAVDERIKNVAALKETLVAKPKTKSALVLDNLIRKNSIDAKGYGSDTELNPADLFLSSKDNAAQNSSKKSLNNNNNILDNNVSANGARPKTIAAVSQLIENKLAAKNSCKLDKIESNISHQKTVLQTPTKIKEDHKILPKSELNLLSDTTNDIVVDSSMKLMKVSKSPKLKSMNRKTEITSKLQSSDKLTYESQFILNKDAAKLKCDNVNDDKLIKVKSEKLSPKKGKTNGEFYRIEDSVLTESTKQSVLPVDSVFSIDNAFEKQNREIVDKKTKLSGSKSIEKVANLLEAMKPRTDAIETAKSLEGEKGQEIQCSVEKPTENPCKSIDRISKTVDKATTLLPKRSEEVASSEKYEDTKEVVASKRCKPIKSVEKVAKLLVSKRPVIKTDEATLVVEDACASPMMSMGKRRRRSGGRRGRRAMLPLALPVLDPKNPPKWSNGWKWDGESYISKVYLSNDSKLDRTARCWSHMRHASGDRVSRGDCVLLRATTARQQPFVARVASLWENPDDGEMMMSLVWYYRPEHTERGRQSEDAPDEVFASRHRDANSVACIEDKCYVLTYNEYCRYRKRLKAMEEGIPVAPSIVPQLPASEVTPAVAPNDSKLPPSVSSELVLFCRKIYDFRSKKLQVPNK